MNSLDTLECLQRPPSLLHTLEPKLRVLHLQLRKPLAHECQNDLLVTHVP